MSARWLVIASLAGVVACTGRAGDDTDDTADTGDTGEDTSDTDTGGDTDTADTADTDTDTGGDTDTSDTDTDTGGDTDTSDTADSGDTDTDTDTGPTTPNSITVAPRTLEITGVATVNGVSAAAPGWLVLWDGPCASLGAQRGATSRGAGTGSNIVIETLDPLVTGTYCVSLHVETANAGFDPVDDPQAEEQGVPVEEDWSITVPAGTPDIRVTLGVSGLTSWTFGTVSPALYATELRGSSPTATDPPINLIRGYRYEFRGISTTHPFSIVQASATQVSNNNCVGAHAASLLVPAGPSDADVSAAGTLEGDADIAFVNQTTSPAYVRFTIDPTLAGTANVRYRCGDHEAMCGTVTFIDP